MTDENPTPEERARSAIYHGTDRTMVECVTDEIRAAVAAEKTEWHKLIAVLMRNLPWGGLKGALLEDSRVKEAIRAEVKDD